VRRPAAIALLALAVATSACAVRSGADRSVLFQQAQSEEAEILKRVVVYDDPSLLDYLARLGRGLASYPPRPNLIAGTASDQASVSRHELTFHVLRDPTLALFTMPSGSVFIHTGLLAAVENEAQLAAALAHELSHMEDARAAAAPDVRPRLDGTLTSGTASAIFARGLAVTGRAALTGYGRARERAADASGLIGMSALGWDPREGPEMFRRVAEWSEQGGPHEIFLFGDPSWLQAREASTRSILAQLAARGGAVSGIRNSEEFERVLRPVVRDNALEDARLGRFTLARRQLARLAAATPEDPRLHLYYGELYRLQAQRATADAERVVDMVQARAAYERALALDPALAEAHRQLGMLYYAMRDTARARDELERYLALAPSALDRARIGEYVMELAR
jgi:beta-barrel assembly-enhancing protease